MPLELQPLINPLSPRYFPCRELPVFLSGAWFLSYRPVTFDLSPKQPAAQAAFNLKALF